MSGGSVNYLGIVYIAVSFTHGPQLFLSKGSPWIDVRGFPYLSIFAPNSHFLGFGFAIQTIGRKFYRRISFYRIPPPRCRPNALHPAPPPPPTMAEGSHKHRDRRKLPKLVLGRLRLRPPVRCRDDILMVFLNFDIFFQQNK